DLFKNRITVKIGQYESVGELKRLIKAEKMHFSIFGASDLRLWLTDLPIGEGNDIPEWDLLDHDEIFSNNQVRFVWQEDPDLSKIHVIIKLPEIDQPKKIILNCLVISQASFKSISRHDVITLETSHDKTVDQLRPMIKEHWSSLFENILPTNFILHYIDRSTTTTIQQQINFYKEGNGDLGNFGTELVP
ncbi:17464_t:CDS:2, partial [Funneliformis geosporum]